MCGILGIVFLNEHKVKDPEITKTLLRRLLLESRVRGTDATGVAFVSHSNTSVIKHNIPADRFIDAEFYKEAERLYLDGEDKAFGPVTTIIGHTRAQTKGTHHDRNNNHPVVASRIIGVHNGSINNDDELFEEYMEEFPETFMRKGWVDTEIIFRLLNHYKHLVGVPMYEAIETAHRLMTGSYACAAVDTASPWMLWLFRDWSPTEILYYPECGLIMFASSKFYLIGASKDLGLGESVEVEHDKESCLSINNISNTFSRFQLEEKKIAHNIGHYP